MLRNDRQIAAAPIRPTRLVRAIVLRIVVRGRNLPGTSLTHVVVLEDAALDACLATMTVEYDCLPANLAALAVSRQIHDGRIDEHRRDAVCRQALVSSAVARTQKASDRARPLRRLRLLDQPIQDEAAIVGKQCTDVIPETVLRVLRIAGLQRLDGANALGAIDVACEVVEPGIGSNRGGEDQGKSRAEGYKRARHGLSFASCRVQNDPRATGKSTGGRKSFRYGQVAVNSELPAMPTARIFAPARRWPQRTTS